MPAPEVRLGSIAPEVQRSHGIELTITGIADALDLALSWTYGYDALDRFNSASKTGTSQGFRYDANDNLTSVTDPRGLVTSYTYSGFGDLKTQTSPDTNLATHTYDSAGNLATSTDARGVVTAYSYDNAIRVTSTSFTLGGITDQIIVFGYDAGANQNGHLTSASDADHDLAWTYDLYGRVTGKGQTVGGTLGTDISESYFSRIKGSEVVGIDFGSPLHDLHLKFASGLSLVLLCDVATGDENDSNYVMFSQTSSVAVTPSGSLVVELR